MKENFDAASTTAVDTPRALHWVFGGTERITGNSFLVEVEKRDAATLLPIIQRHICPGSVIYSLSGEHTAV